MSQSPYPNVFLPDPSSSITNYHSSRALTTETAGKLDVLGLDCDTLCTLKRLANAHAMFEAMMGTYWMAQRLVSSKRETR